MTLARLQALITVVAIVFASLWAAIAWYTGHRAWAPVGALAILVGYSSVLALEFLLVHSLHRNDPTPRATAWQLVRAWWAETCTAPRVFCWNQPFRSQAYPDRPDAKEPHRQQRGVVLVHGFFCNRGLWNGWLRRLHERGIPVVAVNLEPVHGPIDRYADTIEQAVRQIERATGLAPVVVGHSMGGLALRHWWAGADNEARVHRAITIGTPHHGTWLAHFAFSQNGRQMRLKSDWYRQLVSREPPDRATHITCFYGHCDNIVFPASNATLHGADNRHLQQVAHVHMVERPEPYDELLRWLGDAAH